MVDINQPDFVEELDDGSIDMTKLSFIPGEEYVNTMWSPFYVVTIGKCKNTGTLLAAPDTRFLYHELFECVYLR